MPKSRKRHHSRSRSKSRSHSRDRSRDRDDKHQKIEYYEKDRDGKRRKIDSSDSPNQKRSVRWEKLNETAFLSSFFLKLHNMEEIISYLKYFTNTFIIFKSITHLTRIKTLLWFHKILKSYIFWWVDDESEMSFWG